MVPNTPVRLVKDDGPILMFDGQRGYGRRVAGEAMAAAIARCRHTGVVVMTLGHAHHIGRVGAYGELAVAAGLVSLHFVNVTDHRGLVAPFRGSDARFSTNPICFAVPGTPAQPPIVLDMATSEIAMGKVRVALNTGLKCRRGCSSTRTATHDRPRRHVPGPARGLPRLWRHKGYGLALLAELLAGGLSGAGTIQPANPRLGGTVNNMVSFLVDPARLAGEAWLRREIDGFVDYVKASPPADPEAPVLVPGDPERIAARAASREGIPVDAATWHDILAAAEKVGLSRDEARAIVPGRRLTAGHDGRRVSTGKRNQISRKRCWMVGSRRRASGVPSNCTRP